MTLLTVKEVMSANTLRVDPSWTMGNRSGSLIRIRGLESCGVHDSDKCPNVFEMTLTLVGSQITVVKVHGLGTDAALCTAEHQGQNLAKRFRSCGCIRRENRE